MTSQCREWDKKFNVLQLEVFSADNAVQFVKENLKPGILSTPEENNNISKLFGCHPLALQQVLSYINKANMSINDYIELFQNRKKEMLSTPTNDLANGSIYTVLSLSIERIRKFTDHEVTLDLLYITVSYTHLTLPTICSV